MTTFLQFLLLTSLFGRTQTTLPGPRRSFVYPTSSATKATFSKEGRLVLVGAQTGQIALFHGRTALLVSEFTGHRKPIGDLAGWPDRDTVVSGDAGGNVLFWRTGDLSVVRRVSVPGAVKLVRVRPQYPQAAVVSGRTVWLVDASGRVQPIPGATGAGITTLSFTPDGSQLAIGYANGQLVINTLSTGQRQRLPGRKRSIRGLSVGQDSLLVVTGDPTVTLLTRTGGKWAPARSLTTTQPISAITQIGSTVVLGSETGELTTFSLATQQETPIDKAQAPIQTLTHHPREALLLTTFTADSPQTWRLENH